MPDGGSATELVATLRDVLAGLAELDVTALSDGEVHNALPGLLAAVDRLCAVTSTVVASFDVRELCDLDACRSARSWLQVFGRMSQGAATGWLRRGRLLRQLPAVAATAGAGGVSAEQLGIIATLAGEVGVAPVARADRVLADLCAGAGPAELRAACARIDAHLNPDGKDPDPQAMFDKREIVLSRSGSMTHLRGRLDPDGAAALHTALDALMRPPGPDDLRTAGQRRADALADLARLHLSLGDLPTVGGLRPQVGLLITPSMLMTGTGTGTGTENAAESGSLTGAVPSVAPSTTAEAGSTTGNNSAGPPPTGPDAPAMRQPPDDEPGRAGGTACCPAGARQHPPDQPPPAGGDPLEQIGIPRLPELPWMHWIHEVPPALAQRVACDAEVWRTILDPATGLPLELGRSHRIVPPWLRKALHARDRGCRWPGCTAPAAWTDAHHLIPWWLGGPTDIDNLLLLCRYHHVKVHEGQWQMHLDPTTGDVHITRPDRTPYQIGPSRAWTSPGRKARQARDSG